MRSRNSRRLVLAVAVAALLTAAVVIPSLLRSRICGCECPVIEDLRFVVAAEEAYRAAAGHYGRLRDMAAFWTAGCPVGAHSCARPAPSLAVLAGERREYGPCHEGFRHAGPYSFNLEVSPDGRSWSCRACPLPPAPGAPAVDDSLTGNPPRSYWADQTGLIRMGDSPDVDSRSMPTD